MKKLHSIWETIIKHPIVAGVVCLIIFLITEIWEIIKEVVIIPAFESWYKENPEAFKSMVSTLNSIHMSEVMTFSYRCVQVAMFLMVLYLIYSRQTKQETVLESTNNSDGQDHIIQAHSQTETTNAEQVANVQNTDKTNLKESLIYMSTALKTFLAEMASQLEENGVSSQRYNEIVTDKYNTNHSKSVNYLYNEIKKLEIDSDILRKLKSKIDGFNSAGHAREISGLLEEIANNELPIRWIKLEGGTITTKKGDVISPGLIFLTEGKDISVNNRKQVVPFETYIPKILVKLKNESINLIQSVRFNIRNQEAFGLSAYITANIFVGDKNLGVPYDETDGYYSGTRLWSNKEISRQGFQGGFKLHPEALHSTDYVKIAIDIIIVYKNGDKKKLPQRIWEYDKGRNDWIQET